MTGQQLFEDVVEFPDAGARVRYDGLVGLDDVKTRLAKEARLLLDPKSLEEWSRRFHDAQLRACAAFTQRHPLFLFAGDVGTGKSALAESFGDEIARTIDVPVFLYRLSLASRGSGAVGEMTQLLASAFAEVRKAADTPPARDGSRSSAVILLIDEADALAQSRETAQMHHEDRAGVNALLRGVNRLVEADLPVVVVLATNRIGAIDPAVRRRAAATFLFDRPNDTQRRHAFTNVIGDLNPTPAQVDALVALTGPTGDRSFGFTYSDLYQRLIPAAVLASYPDRPLSVHAIVEAIPHVDATPPFVEDLTEATT
jgi:SpoVK/Ycf46/Vps4 family AAA+-type ATPase